jgi:membrane protein
MRRRGPCRQQDAGVQRLSVRRSVLRLPFEVIDLVREWLARFIAVQGFDRAMSISAYAYSALFPLLIVYASVLPRANNKDFSDVLITEFELTGSTAASVKIAFAPAGEVQSSVTLVGVFLLLFSALSFTRGVQRLYEGAYGLPTLGMKNTPRGLLWLLFICVVAAMRPVVTGPLDGWPKVALTVAISVATWIVTPYLLLGRRVPWRLLLPGALLTCIGMTGIGVWSVLWMPHTFAASAHQFGVIGVGFALMGWLFATSVVLVVATAGGALMYDRLKSPPTAA